MPMIDADGCAINVEVDGPARAPVLMLSNSLGTSLHMWDDQVEPFTQHFRLVRYDRRGHGKSSAPEGPYSIDQLGRDAVAIMDALGLDRVNWCGLSMGGMVGMWLGTNAPARIDRLILSNTSSFMGRGTYDERIKAVRERGMAAVANTVIERWFTPQFRKNNPQTMARMRDMLLATAPQGYVGCCAALQAMDQRETIGRITAPTLVIAGRHDLATTVQAGEFIRDRIAGAVLTVLDASHISNVERPQEYADTVLGFLRTR